MQMRLDIFFKTGVMVCIIVGMASVSCKKDNPVAPVTGINFHITNPKNGDTLAWGAAVTVKWTLPANGSIDTVVVYRKPQDQQFYEALNLYFPVVAPVDSFPWNVGSDVAAGLTEKIRIQNKVDSTQFDEVTINIKG
jgi:hypothetical protein